jgi:hypothetical protein
VVNLNQKDRWWSANITANDSIFGEWAIQKKGIDDELRAADDDDWFGPVFHIRISVPYVSSTVIFFFSTRQGGPKQMRGARARMQEGRGGSFDYLHLQPSYPPHRYLYPCGGWNTETTLLCCAKNRPIMVGASFPSLVKKFRQKGNIFSSENLGIINSLSSL